MSSRQRIFLRWRSMSSNSWCVLRLASKPTTLTGSKSIRKILRSAPDLLWLCSSKGRLSQKVRRTNASTLTRNGSCVNTILRRNHISEKAWKRNTTGMVAHANLRKEQKRQGVDDAIAVLLREQKPINFHTVAKAAAVSKAYLYSQPDLRERIEALRLQGVEQMVRERVMGSPGKT